VKWITDRTGRFPRRPYFAQEELDHECEEIVTGFLLNKYGRVVYPISTDDLTVLLEQYVSDLDLYADLSNEGIDVQGVTDFYRDSRPQVRIAEELSVPWRENRLRTTLTHELGHVRFHNFLIWLAQSEPLLIDAMCQHPPRCKRDNILGASSVDWLEWQAGYASGAFLMPVTAVRQIVQEISEVSNVFGPISTNSSEGAQLISQLQRTFQVSAEAARVRLLKLNYLTDEPSPPTLFSNRN
jgi:Zn-dependent peptidase ImmA (M78 family)